MRRELIVLCAVVVVTWLPCGPALAEWSHDASENTPVSTAAYSQSDPEVVTDGAGGAIFVWVDTRNGFYDLFAQRIDAYGDVLWTHDGVVVCDATDHQYYPVAVADGEGGIIVAWADKRGGAWDTYAQRLDSSGATLWTLDGVAVCDTTDNQYVTSMVADGAGGAFIVWEDNRSGSGDMYTDIYGQHVDGYGSPLWTHNGYAVRDWWPEQNQPVVAADGAGGAIFVWRETNGGTGDIYGQRVTDAGVAAWGFFALAICSEDLGEQQDPSIVSDGFGGAIVVWSDYRNGNADIYGQRIDSAANVLWTVDGTPLCDEGSSQYDVQSVSDGDGGVFLVWTDSRNGLPDVFAQRVDVYGNTLWSSDGVSVCGAPGHQMSPAIAVDGAGGVVIGWGDWRYGEGDIYAQRLDGSGDILWTSDGVEVSGALYVQEECALTSDGAGGLIAAWSDERVPDGDVYAQRVERNGYLGYPCAGITSVVDHPDDQGGQVIVSWAPSYLDEWPVAVIDYYTLWRRLGGTASRGSESAPAPWLLDRADIEALERYGWIYVDQVDAMLFPEYGYIAPTFGDSTESGTVVTDYMVLAHDTYINDYWTSESVSGYSIDNLAPGAPTALAAAPEQTDVELTWSPSGHDDEDLDFYNVYRGSVSGFTPGAGAFIGTAVDTFYTDFEPGGGTWYYLVTAEDIHANEGDASNEASAETWTGVAELPTSYALRGCHPNPFNPMTSIAYDVPEPGGRVTLEIFDVRGRLVRTLVTGADGPGRKESVWRGVDDSGAPVSSGIYFCRMTAPGFEETLKLTLLK
jgi:hypothetical protein